MEYWKIGIVILNDLLILYLIRPIYLKNGFSPQTHYSNIPLFHPTTMFGYAKARAIAEKSISTFQDNLKVSDHE